jgi:hypothetical protein
MSLPSVIVVGSAHHLLSVKLRKVIDQFDTVVRVNKTTVAGNEDNIGVRCTHLVLTSGDSRSFETLRGLKLEHDRIFGRSAYSDWDAEWISRVEEVILREDDPPNLGTEALATMRAVIPPGPKISYVHTKGGEISNGPMVEKMYSLFPRSVRDYPDDGVDPTTGLVAMAYTIDRWQTPIHVVGFGYRHVTIGKLGESYEYKTGETHNIDYERTILNDWESEGLVIRLGV